MAGDDFNETDFPLRNKVTREDLTAKYSYFNWLYHYIRHTDDQGRILPRFNKRIGIKATVDNWIWYDGK
jgi:hypothetical protein